MVDLPGAERLEKLEALTLPTAVRDRLERLLEANDQPGILDSPMGSGLDFPDSTADDDALIGKVIGPYRLQSLLGRGGMSSVYLALRADGAYDAPVAFKLLGSAFSGSTWRDRFRRETAWLADLRHPGIAALLDAGTMHDGTPYLVTELIDGKPIDQWCRDRRANLRTTVALAADLCDAVAFAQQRLIIHRDIKAGNVLVTPEGQVKLLDFGIARPLSARDEQPDESPMTRLFTPEYAAPEQFSGEAVSTATDVFSLGVLLYRLLTDEMPFSSHTPAGGDLSQTALAPSRRVTTAENLSDVERRSRRRQLRGGLDNVVGKALEFDPARRYENAASLAVDLRNWLAHRPLLARRPSLGYRVGLFIRRRTSLALALAGLVLVLAGGVSATVWQGLEARNQAREALAASARAEAVGEFLISLFDASDPDQVGREPPSARSLLDGGLQRIDGALDQDPQIRRALLLAMGRIYQKLGETGIAGQALVQSGALDSDDPNERARAYLLQALIDYDQGDPQAALIAIDSALAQAASDMPAELEISLTQSRIRYLRHTGKGAEAVQTGRALLDRLDRASASPDLHLAVLTDMTAMLSSEGFHDEAMAISDQAMSLIEAGYGVPTTQFNALANRSYVLLRLGRLTESVDDQRRALELGETIYPEGHRRLVSLNGNLANRLTALGAWQEAEERFQRALALYDKLSPEPSFRSAAVHNNYSVLLYNSERYAEALEHARVAAALAIETFGPEDPRAVTARFNVANTMSWLGYVEAADEMVELIELRRQRAEEFPLALAGIQGGLADHYRRFGQLDLALAMAEQAASIIREYRGQPHNELIGPLVQYAQVLAALDRPDQAGEQFAFANAVAMELGANAGFTALRMVDRYSEWLLEHDPEAARQLLRAWLDSEPAQFARESPLLARLHSRFQGASE